MNRLIVLITLIPAIALSAGPVVKIGDCPVGYIWQGSYCIPMQGADNIIPKVGDCPTGYLWTGNYCSEMKFPKKKDDYDK